MGLEAFFSNDVLEWQIVCKRGDFLQIYEASEWQAGQIVFFKQNVSRINRD
jgi:hypothetical protein